MISLTHVYHSCFLLETDAALVVFDYWKDPQGLLAQRLQNIDKQLYFVVSHFHEDHYNPEIFNYEQAVWLLSNDAIRRRRVDKSLPGLVRMIPGTVYEDERIRFQAFRSTDIGVSVAVTLPDGTVAFHAGDLNNWYFPQQAEEHIKVPLADMERLFQSVVREVRGRYGKIDYLMFPIDPRLGRETLRGITQWLFQIPTAHLYPMHTWEQDIIPYLSQLEELFPHTEIVG